MVVFSATLRQQGNQQTTDATYDTQFFPVGLPNGRYHVWFLGSLGQTSSALGVGSGCMNLREVPEATNLLTRDFSKTGTINTVPYTDRGYSANQFLYGMCASRGEMKTAFTAGEKRVGGWYMGVWDYQGQPIAFIDTFGGQFLRNGVVYFNAYRAE